MVVIGDWPGVSGTLREAARRYGIDQVVVIGGWSGGGGTLGEAARR